LRLELEKLRGWVNPADAFVAMHSKDPNAFWLDRSENPDEPVSILGSAGSVIRAGDETFALASEHLKRFKPRSQKSRKRISPSAFDRVLLAT
jgi:hypothetical protein